MKKSEEKKNKELTKEQRYILKAAKLKGLAAVEIEGLRKHFTGEAPNDFVVRRNPDLFELLSKKKNEEQGLVRDDEGTYVALDNVIVSKVESGELGTSKILTPSLTSYISKPITSVDESSKFYDLSSKNELFLPYIARALGVDAAVFEEAVLEDETGDQILRHLTRNFVREDERFISGNQILNKDKDKDKTRNRVTTSSRVGKEPTKKVSMTLLLERVEKFVKKFGKREGLSDEEISLMKIEIRRGLIKQTFVNKLILNDNESNSNWGLIRKDKTLRLSPLYGFNCSAGVMRKSELPTRRVVWNTGRFGGREDIQSFMLEFGKEAWFRDWVKESLGNFSIDDVFKEAEEKSNLQLSSQEQEYYRAVLDKTIILAKEVIDVDFNEKKFGILSLFKNRPNKIIHDIDKDDSINFDR